MPEPHHVARIVFQHIEDGDRRKFAAVSNDADTGGGARDLRFRPANRFMPVFGLMFPGREARVRNRGDAQPASLTLVSGMILTPQAALPDERGPRPIKIWPETDARPGECRISRVNRYGFSALLPPAQGEGKVILMLIQTYDGQVTAWFTTEHLVRNSPNWDVQVRDFAVRWLDTDSKCAFLDLERAEEFMND